MANSLTTTPLTGCCSQAPHFKTASKSCGLFSTSSCQIFSTLRKILTFGLEGHYARKATTVAVAVAVRVALVLVVLLALVVLMVEMIAMIRMLKTLLNIMPCFLKKKSSSSPVDYIKFCARSCSVG